MSMYGLDTSFYDYGGFSHPSITRSFYNNPIDFDDDLYFRRRPPPITISRHTPPTLTPTIEQRHDGTSPLPLGMDWEGTNTVWPHNSHKKWSYCVTVPSWTTIKSPRGSDTVFFKLQVGIQSPEGITSTRQVQRRFNEFLKLYSELKKEFPKKNLPPAPPKRLTKLSSDTLLEERRSALEVWMEKLLSDINVSRNVLVAIFLELEAAARKSCSELNLHDSTAKPVPSNQVLPNAASLIGSGSSITSDQDNSCANETFEDQNHGEPNIESERSGNMQLDLEELMRKCVELEMRLTIEQDARAHAESIAATTIHQNAMLIKELDDVKKQVKSLCTSYSELKQELNKCLKDEFELENEKQDGQSETLIKETDEEHTQ